MSDDDYYLPSDWQSPRWEQAGRVHDWRNYLSEEIHAAWDTFTDEQKKMLARYAEELAGREEWD